MVTELWTPQGLVYVGRTLIGTSPEDNEKVYSHQFRIRWKGYDVEFSVACEETTSKAHLEDMAAAKCEKELGRIAVQVQKKGGKINYTKLSPSMKKEVAEALREWKKWNDRRKNRPFSKPYY